MLAHDLTSQSCTWLPQRIDKEQAQADKFWMQQALKSQQATANNALNDTASMVTSVAPSGYTSKTSVSLAHTRHSVLLG